MNHNELSILKKAIDSILKSENGTSAKELEEKLEKEKRKRKRQERRITKLTNEVQKLGKTFYFLRSWKKDVLFLMAVASYVCSSTLLSTSMIESKRMKL